jgi:pimeloyl-ACP methyl ester carboxylesterase
MERKEPGGDPLLSEAERDYYVAAFQRSGFTNPINWYRNWTRNWEALEGVDQVIDVPTLFIAAADDVIIAPEQIEAMKPWVRDLTIKMLEPCGHWTQQEHPNEVNQLIIDWLGRKRR